MGAFFYFPIIKISLSCLLFSSDNLAYKITIPGDITQVWNTGNNSYKANATGEFETIEINAQIVPDKSSSMYIAQDSYTDTVTAIIAY